MNSQDLLRLVLRGDAVTTMMIDQLLADEVAEDQWLEYKRGAWLGTPARDRNVYLKERVSSFANAEGGTFVVGLANDEGGPPNWSVDGCPLPEPKQWAESVLRKLGPHLVPFPRLQVVQHPDGPVLIIGIERAPNLVPVAESPTVEYFLRIGAQTLKVPPYLHADLALGRRSRPNLVIGADFRLAKNENSNVGGVNLNVHVENDGIVWADSVRTGLIAYVVRDHLSERRIRAPFRKPTESLLRHVDSRAATGNTLLGHWQGPAGDLDPFERLEERVQLILTDIEPPCAWLAAAYAIPRNGPPMWAQLRAELLDTGPRSGRGTIRMLPPGRRPIVFYGSLHTFIEQADQNG